jgi:uncharacterized membrane protein
MEQSSEIPGMDEVFTDEVKFRIEHAIHHAEMSTSAELRVHLEDHCPENPLDRASFIFSQLNMHTTNQRNGVLIYLALKDRKLAIIGDVGINVHMPENAWNDIYTSMSEFLKTGRYEQGLIHGVEEVGKAIKSHFPIQHGDRNELPNQVTTGNNLKT